MTVRPRAITCKQSQRYGLNLEEPVYGEILKDFHKREKALYNGNREMIGSKKLKNKNYCCINVLRI